ARTGGPPPHLDCCHVALPYEIRRHLVQARKHRPPGGGRRPHRSSSHPPLSLKGRGVGGEGQPLHHTRTFNLSCKIGSPLPFIRRLSRAIVAPVVSRPLPSHLPTRFRYQVTCHRY